MKRAIFGIFAISFSLLLISCNTTEPPPPPNGEKPTLELKFEDASCTEAWIQLTTTDLILPSELITKQINSDGDTLSQIYIITTQDSLLYIDSLLPNQTYTLQASSIEHQVSSNQLSVATMDTTSHNFTFETFTFGEHSSSVLYDCDIISLDNVWCVGEIYMNDTLGQPDPKRYNAAIWNGNNWDIIRVPYNYQGTDFYHPIQAVFAFGPNDIWFCGNGVVHYDGNNFIPITIPTNVWGSYQMNKIWGNSSNDLYVVGNNGNIAHYNGQSWERIVSGTDVNINDVIGVTDQINNQRKVFCAVSNVFNISDHKILTIDESNNVDSLHWDTGRRVNSTWTNNGKIVYTSGGGVFNNKSGGWQEEKALPLYYTNRIRGNGLNDIFVAGDFGLLAHFNGMSWNVYNEFLFNASSLSVSVNEYIITAVGREGTKALIIVGKRN